MAGDGGGGGGDTSPTTAEYARPGVPSRNPLPLSNSQEAQVREIYHRRVRQCCAEEIKAFAECATGRTFSITWACKLQRRAMNSCMKAHATPVEQDAAREEWFADRLERQRERELRARRKAQQEDFLREWWGMPEADRERRRRETEVLRLGERVGGRRGGGGGGARADEGEARGG